MIVPHYIHTYNPSYSYKYIHSFRTYMQIVCRNIYVSSFDKQVAFDKNALCVYLSNLASDTVILSQTGQHAWMTPQVIRCEHWWKNWGAYIGFRSRFSQCVDYMRFNEKSFCFRWQETTKLVLFGNTKTSSLVILCDLRYLTGNISSVMTKHMGVQRKLHRFAYLIVQIILCFYL